MKSTGKVAIVGNNVSHSHHKTKRKFSPNLKTAPRTEQGCLINGRCRQPE